MSGDYSKCPCADCGESIEFPAEYVGQSISCPHCSAMTLLTTDVLMQDTPVEEPRIAAPHRPKPLGNTVRKPLSLRQPTPPPQVAFSPQIVQQPDMMQQAMLQQQAMQQQAMQQQAMLQQQAMQQQAMQQQPLMMQQPMQQQLMQQQPMQQQFMMQAPAIPMQVVPTHYSAGHMFCKNCGAPITKVAAICLKCGAAQQGAADLLGADGDKPPTARLTYILAGFFFGCFGVHNFIAGYTHRGAAQAIITFAGLMISKEARGVREVGWACLLVMGAWSLYEICTVVKDSKGRPFS